MANPQDTRTGKLVVNVSIPTPPPGKPVPRMNVYLFDAAGRLLQTAPAQAQVEFSIDPSRKYRVTAGPDFLRDTKTAPADLAQKLVQASAVSADYLPQLKQPSLALKLSPNVIVSWIYHCVNVHGTVRKLLNPGGSPAQYAPICTGVVQTFRIDLACTLNNLSSSQLDNLKATMLSRMIGREINDILTGNWGDFNNVSPLAAGLFPLSGTALKNYIFTNRAELAQFMCNIIPEYLVCWEQYPDTPIQSDGTFSTEVCFWFWETPDLYFEVVQTVDGVTKEVADPDILCTLQVNYDGSQAVTITVDDPTAVACQPDPNPGPGYLYVWPTAIGNVDLRNIDGLETLAGTGLLPGQTPWGGTLPMQMQFHPDLQANNIVYYRWSYKFDGDADYTAINASVTHRWQEITIGPGGVIVIHLHGYTFGPKLVGAQPNLFEIPDPSLPWVDINDPLDRPLAYFDSTAGQTPGRSGMCTLRLEMFDGAGNAVSCGNAGHAGPFQYLLPDLGGAPDTYTNAPAPNIDSSGNLIFRIRVDNNPTRAALYDARTGSHGSGDACGMRHYSGGADPVTIDYAATQPNNVIDWSLGVTRGMCGGVASTGGNTSSPDPAHFTNTASVLLGPNATCATGCIQAAFAVNLYCWARATNGYARQSQYDSSATMAFALLTP